MEINPNADKAGLNPTNYLNKPQQFTIVEAQDGDCLEAEERTAKKGGEFVQYGLHLKDSAGMTGVARYLFERDLALTAKAYGSDTKTWIGKPVQLTGIPDPNNAQYTKFLIEPITQ